MQKEKAIEIRKKLIQIMGQLQEIEDDILSEFHEEAFVLNKTRMQLSKIVDKINIHNANHEYFMI